MNDIKSIQYVISSGEGVTYLARLRILRQREDGTYDVVIEGITKKTELEDK